mgnify:FL=1
MQRTQKLRRSRKRTADSIVGIFSMKRVSVIGVGNMGGAMARRLLDGGYMVQVYDVDATKTTHLKSFGAEALIDTAQAAIN